MINLHAKNDNNETNKCPYKMKQSILKISNKNDQQTSGTVMNTSRRYRLWP